MRRCRKQEQHNVVGHRTLFSPRMQIKTLYKTQIGLNWAPMFRLLRGTVHVILKRKQRLDIRISQQERESLVARRENDKNLRLFCSESCYWSLLLNKKGFQRIIKSAYISEIIYIYMYEVSYVSFK